MDTNLTFDEYVDEHRAALADGTYRAKPTDSEKAYYAQFVGATIVGFDFVITEGEPGIPSEAWPTFTMRLADGSLAKVEVSEDDDGNGPGFLLLEMLDA